jgi:hypothetical protein
VGIQAKLRVDMIQACSIFRRLCGIRTGEYAYYAGYRARVNISIVRLIDKRTSREALQRSMNDRERARYLFLSVERRRSGSGLFGGASRGRTSQVTTEP